MPNKWPATVERYLNEGLSVSGGDANPGDKLGYKVVTLASDDDAAGAQLTALRNDGFEVVTMFVSSTGIARVILDNYKGKS